MNVLASLIWTTVGGLLTVGLPITHHGVRDGVSRPFLRDPYCLVDPSCLNPFGSGADGLTNHGFARNDFEDMNEVRGLAWPNYLFFMLIAVAMAAVIARLVSRPEIRITLLGILWLFVALEVNRWFSLIPTSGAGGELSWTLQHLAVDAVSLGGLYLASRRRAA